MSAIDAATAVLENAIGRRVFPAASVEVGASDGVLWRHALGRLTFDESAVPASDSTVYDLASLTKAIATTTVVFDLIAGGRLGIDEPISAMFHEWRGSDREQVTVQDLLEHASGLPARLVDAPPSGRREFEHDICTMPLEYAPRSASVYSDLGFLLLGFLAADRGGSSLAAQFDDVCARMVSVMPGIVGDVLAFDLGARSPSVFRNPERTAPTQPLDDDPRRGRLLVGEVHDGYAAALGGVAGHAGLFGTTSAVGAFARVVLRAARGDGMPVPLSPVEVMRAVARSSVPGSSRGLGWDTMLPTSSCGVRMSRQAFGHVGFTGTSLWIDPTRDRYFVLLTNRACGGGSLDAMREVRRAFHDALGEI